MVQYLLKKSKSDEDFNSYLNGVLHNKGGSDVGIIFNERIINMPPPVAAPSFKMLLEEIGWANDAVHPILFFSNDG